MRSSWKKLLPAAAVASLSLVVVAAGLAATSASKKITISVWDVQYFPKQSGSVGASPMRPWVGSTPRPAPRGSGNRLFEGLEGGLLAVKPAQGARRELSARFALIGTKGADFGRVTAGEGWHPEESDAKSGTRWAWTKGDATVRVENPHAWPLRVVCTLDGWSLGARDLTLTVAGAGPVRAPETRNLSAQRVKTTFPEIVVPPGGAEVTLRSVQPWMTASPGETRVLGVCVFGWELAVRR